MNRITSHRRQLGLHHWPRLPVGDVGSGVSRTAGRWVGLDRQLCLFGYLRKKSGKILTGAKNTGPGSGGHGLTIRKRGNEDESHRNDGLARTGGSGHGRC